MSKDQLDLTKVAEDILQSQKDFPEEWAKSDTENKSTDLSPAMRKACTQILGFHLDFDATKEEVLVILNERFPDHYNNLKIMLKEIEYIDKHNELIPLIQSLVLEALNPKDNDANEFAKKWATIFNKTRAKIDTKPTGKSKDKQIRNDTIIKLHKKLSSKKVGKKTEFFDLRKPKHTQNQIYNIIKDELKLDISVCRIAEIIHKPKKR